jgi:hypothetical protein
MRVWQARVESGSDGDGEFGEGRRELSLRVSIDAEFVMAAPEVLDNAWPVLMTRAERSRFSPRIGANLALSLP